MTQTDLTNPFVKHPLCLIFFFGRQTRMRPKGYSSLTQYNLGSGMTRFSNAPSSFRATLDSSTLHMMDTILISTGIMDTILISTGILSFLKMSPFFPFHGCQQIVAKASGHFAKPPRPLVKLRFVLSHSSSSKLKKLSNKFGNRSRDQTSLE